MMRNHSTKPAAPWRDVIVARFDHEETLSCGHKWHLPLHDKISKHAKKRRCKDCAREEVANERH